MTTTFLDRVHQLADEWERKGWLHKFHDQLGQELWELTPLGRRELNLPALNTQNQ